MASHPVHFGVDWEYNRGGQLVWSNDPATLMLFSPGQVRTYNQAPSTTPSLRISLPASFNTLSDVLQLPLQSVTIGIGDPRTRQANGSLVRTWSTERLYVQDTWRVKERLTLNYGLVWSMDGYKNYDLRKPEFLAPILGESGLAPAHRNWKNSRPPSDWPGRQRRTEKRPYAGAPASTTILLPELDRCRPSAARPDKFGPPDCAGERCAQSAGGHPGNVFFADTVADFDGDLRQIVRKVSPNGTITGIDRNSAWIAQLRPDRGAPSPPGAQLNLGKPVPATVVMIPLGETRRMR